MIPCFEMSGIPALKIQESPTIRGIISDLDGVAYRGDIAILGSVRAFRVWHPFNAATGVVPDRIVSSLLDLLDATSETAGPPS